MRGNRAFNIDIYGLKNGIHEYQFEYDETLFERYEESVVNKGSGICDLILEKSETMIGLNFQIKGEVELICDRSSEPFNYEISLEERLLLKYGESLEKVNDEVWIIPGGHQTINVEENIYEYISVAIPMKKLHPKFGDDDSEGLELIYSSGESLEEDNSSEETTDPRWEALKKLKNSEN